MSENSTFNFGGDIGEREVSSEFPDVPKALRVNDEFHARNERSDYINYAKSLGRLEVIIERLASYVRNGRHAAANKYVRRLIDDGLFEKTQEDAADDEQ